MPIGCWKENIDIFKRQEGYFLKLFGDYKSRDDPIEKCASVAASLGLQVFAIGNGGMCYTSEVDNEEKLELIVQSDTCGHKGKGSQDAFTVYQITSITSRKFTMLFSKVQKRYFKLF